MTDRQRHIADIFVAIGVGGLLHIAPEAAVAVLVYIWLQMFRNRSE